MKSSTVFLMIWRLTALILLYVNFWAGISWAISSFITHLLIYQKKKERNSKNKKIPAYIQ